MRQPLAHLWVLVGRIVLDDGVGHLSHGDLRLDLIEEADKLLMAMTLHVAANDGAIEDVEGWERVVVPCRLQSCVIVPPRLGFNGSLGWVRSSAWIWLFSSTQRTTAWAG